MTKTATKERATAPLFGEVDPPAKPKAKVVHVAPKSKKKTGTEVAVAKPLENVAPMNMLAVLANAAADPKCEPAKMRELYAIHKEMAQDQAKIEFVRDFAELQAENLHINAKGKIVIPPKDGKTGQSTPYAKFNDINKAIKPLLQKHGFTLSFETEPAPDGARLIVKGLLAHKGGHQRTTAFPLPAEVSGSKNNVQGWGSSMSYGKRYCTIALLNLTSEAMEDRDDDGADKPATEINADQLKDLRAKMTAANVDDELFCVNYKIEKVEQLPASKLANALDLIARKQKAVGL